MHLQRLCGILVLTLLFTAAWGESRLDRFERDVAQADPPTPTNHDRDRDNDEKGHEPGPEEWSRLSYLRVAKPRQASVPYIPRQCGEPLLPMARVDVAFRIINPDMQACDWRAEGGYGAVALFVNTTRYREAHPADTLDVTEILLANRLSISTDLECAPGLGAFILAGKSTFGRAAVTVPFFYHPRGHPWGAELRLLAGDGMNDVDLAAVANTRYLSLKVGYRTMFSEHMSLAGPYVGMSLQY